MSVRPKLTAAFFLCFAALAAGAALFQEPGKKTATVKSTEDFEVTGNGSSAAWEKAEWVPLRKRNADGHPYDARFKTLYSKTGIYFLMDGTDAELTSRMQEDFLDLWNEDVFEVFLWTDERHPVYFEYEVSPLGHELPILIPNFDGKFLGWRPWHYDGSRRTRKATAARRAEGARREGHGLARRGLHPFRAPEPARKCSAEVGHSVARQRLPRRPRRREVDGLGLGTGRSELSRVQKLWDARV